MESALFISPLQVQGKRVDGKETFCCFEDPKALMGFKDTERRLNVMCHGHRSVKASLTQSCRGRDTRCSHATLDVEPFSSLN